MKISSNHASAGATLCLLVLCVWVQTVGLHLAPIMTIGVCAALSLGLTALSRKSALLPFSSSTTRTSDLGRRGIEREAVLEADAERLGAGPVELHVTDQEAPFSSSVDVNWVPGTNRVVVTREAYNLPDDQLRALVVYEVMLHRSRLLDALKSFSTLRVLSLVGVRLGALAFLVGLDGSLTLVQALWISLLALCVSRVFTTSAVPLADWAAARFDKRAYEISGPALPAALRRCLEGIPEGSPAGAQRSVHLARRIERLEALPSPTLVS